VYSEEEDDSRNEIPILKFQIPKKHQAPISNDLNEEKKLKWLSFWTLEFGACDLVLKLYNNSS
jgi:hypothetical protein